MTKEKLREFLENQNDATLCRIGTEVNENLKLFYENYDAMYNDFAECECLKFISEKGFVRDVALKTQKIGNADWLDDLIIFDNDCWADINPITREEIIDEITDYSDSISVEMLEAYGYEEEEEEEA